MTTDTMTNKRKNSGYDTSMNGNTRASKRKRNSDEMEAPDQMTGLPPMTSSLLETGKYSDLTIKCRERVFKIHRSIVCLQSKLLAAMVDGDFLEAKSGVISLEEEDPQIFERVVKFMYTSDYSNSLDSATTATAVTASTNSGTVPRDLIVHTRVYISAEKWDIPALKNLAAKKFEDALLLEGETSSFAESLRLMFEETPENDRLLKDVALKFAGNNYKELISMGEFKAMCKKNGEVAIEVLTAVATAAAASSLSLSFYCPCLMCVQNARKLATLQSTPETTSRSVELSAAKTAVPSSMGT